MKKIIPISFVFIVLIAALLRLYQLGTIPPGVNRDEASIGYTAYSLLKTGNDEYGKALPISFQSFGDWKLPVYIYETVFSVGLLGLNTLAVRVPSAVAGILLVFLVYFMVMELFRDKTLALLSMLVTAISPWSIHLSRVESESNTAVLLVTAGVYIFLLSLRKHAWMLLLSAVLFALSYGTYAGNYIFTTLLVFGLFFIYRKKVVARRLGIIAIILFILLSGTLWYKTTGANIVKISGTGIFGDPAVVNASIEVPRNEHLGIQSRYVGLLLHNRAVYGGYQFAKNFLNAFSPDFLFFRGGGNHAHNILNFGNMYLIEAPFLLFGLALLLLKKKDAPTLLALWWFFASVVAPSITKDAPHTNRMFAIFPMLPLIVAYGIVFLMRVYDIKKIRFLIIAIVGTLYLINITLYLDRYYIHFPYEESQHWGIIYEKLNRVLSERENQYKHVIMEGAGESPYIYFLFYNAYDPFIYQKEAVRYPETTEGFVHVQSFNRYEFRDIDWARDPYLANTILVAKSEHVPQYIREGFSIVDVKLPNGDAFYSLIKSNDVVLNPLSQ